MVQEEYTDELTEGAACSFNITAADEREMKSSVKAPSKKQKKQKLIIPLRVFTQTPPQKHPFIKLLTNVSAATYGKASPAAHNTPSSNSLKTLSPSIISIFQEVFMTAN